TVAVVAGTVFSTSASPNPADQRSSRSRTTAAESPGTPRRCMAASTAASTAAARPGGSNEIPGVIAGVALGAGEGAGDAGAGDDGDGEAATVGEGGVRGFDASAVATAAINRTTAPRPGCLIRPGLLQPVP